MTIGKSRVTPAKQGAILLTINSYMDAQPSRCMTSVARPALQRYRARPSASNEWVISGNRTESGKPILANDPHLGLEAPILWYLARIVTPELSVEGATVPGLPVILLGQNDHIAWGFTTTGSDIQDLFIETVDPQHPDLYLTPGGSEPFQGANRNHPCQGRGKMSLYKCE